MLLDSIADYAILLLDADGRVASWSSGAERIKGYTEKEIIGVHFSVFYPVEEAADGKLDRELQVWLRDGRSEEDGWRVRKDGSRFWANRRDHPDV
ncbi:MAG TPA: PAS domain S-box protein [Candidatus Dormibacteraeota bacterium]|nr:PAS domain S-box protein [Candidatus Dormibacteraeota bacterium]